MFVSLSVAEKTNVTLSHHCDYDYSCVTKIRNQVGIKLRGSVEGGGMRGRGGTNYFKTDKHIIGFRIKAGKTTRKYNMKKKRRK